MMILLLLMIIIVMIKEATSRAMGSGMFMGLT